ncbi:DUF2934 domain-containing protein [Methylobacterium thuringiense]|uniref:DUF2934 domain-containing protein n=1 Tax=Methylobacterium thuringiense TaxID=1003091 RepID=A0ABQ4TK59_9HYPH|nr:DUF2934 domain-containing protein [Methylobacterium thuringiense]GJE54993.1 hypothetical protein EKPJFOCH_1479 [Methylobacterium thuringiense]
MDVIEHRVRERAYYIWEGEGRVVGRADAHWFQAEAEFAAEAVPVAEVSVGKAAPAARAKAPAKVAAPKPAKAAAKAAAPKAPKAVAAKAPAKPKKSPPAAEVGLSLH